MEAKEGKHNYFLTGLSIGAVLGGVAGFLFAPKSGRELRADITSTGEKAFDETRGFIGKTQHQVSEARQRARDFLSCVKEKGGRTPQYRAESEEESVVEA